jgi:hypothetical protein
MAGDYANWAGLDGLDVTVFTEAFNSSEADTVATLRDFDIFISRAGAHHVPQGTARAVAKVEAARDDGHGQRFNRHACSAGPGHQSLRRQAAMRISLLGVLTLGDPDPVLQRRERKPEILRHPRQRRLGPTGHINSVLADLRTSSQGRRPMASTGSTAQHGGARFAVGRQQAVKRARFFTVQLLRQGVVRPREICLILSPRY